MTRRLRTVLGALLALALMGVVAPPRPAEAAPAAGLAAWKVVDLDLPVNDVAYDAGRDRFLATVDSTDAGLGNELVELHPRTGALGRRVAVGSQPQDVALSDDGTTAYIALGGANRIVQVDLGTFTVTRSFTTGVDSLRNALVFAEQLAVRPGHPDIVIASLKRPSGSPRFFEVVAFDDGVALPDRITDDYPDSVTANAIEALDADHLIGVNLEDTRRDVQQIDIDATGLHLADVHEPEWGGLDIEASEGRIYTTTGHVVDPSGPDGGTVVREHPVYMGGSGYLVEPVPAADAVAYLDHDRFSTYANDGSGGESHTFDDLSVFPTGLTASRSSFAVASTWGLYLLGPTVGPKGLVPPPPPTNHVDDLALQSTEHRVSALPVQDPVRPQLYLPVSSYVAPGRLNRIDAIDPATGKVVRSLPLPGQPSALAVSDDGTVLYVGFRDSEQAKIARVRIDLPVMALVDLVPVVRPTDYPVAWDGTWVRALSVRPGHADTVAVAVSDAPTVIVAGARQDLTEHWGSQLAFTDEDHVWGIGDHLGIQPIELRDDGSVVTLEPSPIAFHGHIAAGGGRLYAAGKIIDVDDPRHPSLIADLGTTYEAAFSADGTRIFTAPTSAISEHDVARARTLHTEPFPSYNADGLVRTSAGLAVLQSQTSPNGGLEPEVILLRPPHEPTITSLSVDHGPASGGARVKITGTELERIRSVHFGLAAATFTRVDGHTLNAVAPAHVAGPVDVTVTSSGGTSEPTADSEFTYDAEPAFRAVGPWRVIDTRETWVAYTPAAGAVLQAEVPTGFGVGGIDGDAAAVWLSVTAVGGPTPGYLTVWPCDRPQPGTSNVNVTEPNQVVANLVLTEIGPSRKICVFTSQPTHVVVDLAGTTPKGTGYQPIVAARLHDSRTTGGGARPAAGSTTRVHVTGRGGVPSSGVGGVSVNVTATGPAGPGWVTAWSCDQPRPRASTLNLDHAGQTVANFAIAGLGASGDLCLYTSGGTHLIADAVGWWATGVLRPLGPTRIFDTRPGPEHLGSISLMPGNIVEIVLTDHTDIPPGEWAGAILNVTLTNTIHPGYVTVYPRGERPWTSNLNVIRSGQTVAVAVVLGPADLDRFYLYTEGGGDVLIDVIAWLPHPQADSGVALAR